MHPRSVRRFRGARRTLAAVAGLAAAPFVSLSGAPEPVSAAPAAPNPVAVAPTMAPVTLDPSMKPARGTVSPTEYSRDRAAFELRVDGTAVPFSVLAISVQPGSDVVIEAGDAPAAGDFGLRHAAGGAVEAAPGRWVWTAPEAPGIHAVEVARVDGSTVRLNMLVLHPRSTVKAGVLNGFRIGEYESTPLRGQAAYLPPEGFVEVLDLDEDILVSPHFTLGQFLCKQPGEPRYLALSTPLLVKLEAVLEATNDAGIRAGTFHVMSGFRTPWYNKSIGNKTVYSRHLWGDAADIFVDVDGDGDMDDLDGDGRSTMADAHLLADIADRVEREGKDGLLAGGVGVYRRNAAHGPFVHVDARGTAARW